MRAMRDSWRALVEALAPTISAIQESNRLRRLAQAKASVALYQRALAREQAGLEKAQAAEARALADIAVADAARTPQVPVFLLKRDPEAPATITPLSLPRQRSRVVRRGGSGSVTPFRGLVARRAP